VLESSDSHHKIAVIPIEGVIFGSAVDLGGLGLVRQIQDQLKLAERDARVKAVILKVNSPGGEVMASDDISRAIAEFQKKTGKPVVASMGSVAASGGYYVAAPCRWIVANELTITGSIGVIMHGYNYRGLMNKVGVQPQVYKSGRFKDMLSGERDLEKMSAAEKATFEEEERMIQALIDQTYTKFRKVVQEGRRNSSELNQANRDATGRKLSAQWIEAADGRVISGAQAYELGFVDELGTWETAVSRAKKLARIADAELVQFQPVFDLLSFFRIFGKAETRAVKLDLGMALPRLDPGLLYFLSPTYVR
jgi:protease IV